MLILRQLVSPFLQSMSSLTFVYCLFPLNSVVKQEENNGHITKNQHNFAADYFEHPDKYADLTKDFMSLNGAPHMTSNRNGYMGQFICAIEAYPDLKSKLTDILQQCEVDITETEAAEKKKNESKCLG